MNYFKARNTLIKGEMRPRGGSVSFVAATDRKSGACREGDRKLWNSPFARANNSAIWYEEQTEAVSKEVVVCTNQTTQAQHQEDCSIFSNPSMSLELPWTLSHAPRRSANHLDPSPFTMTMPLQAIYTGNEPRSSLSAHFKQKSLPVHLFLLQLTVLASPSTSAHGSKLTSS